MAALAVRLIEQGHLLVDRIEEAQIIVVNTCSVTAGTEAKIRRMLRQLSRQAPHGAICVTGCLAQQKAYEMKQVPNVRWVVGNALKDNIPGIILNGKEGIYCESLAVSHDPLHLFPETPVVFNAYRRTRFSIKIQEGCDFRCAYCIVPFLRGPSRSASARDIVRLCGEAAIAGYKEIVLTGTHIGQYQSETGEDLIKLLERLSIIPGDFRIRLSSLDQRDCSAALIDLVGNNPRFCRHLHLSVQSLSEEVLSAMNRPASAIRSFIEAIINFRTRFADAGIGGDFITGFPGETEANFRETLENIEKIGFSYGHVFRFSKRPMTAAAHFPGQIDEKEKRERSARLRALLDRCHHAFIRKLAGSRHRIIVEKEDPASGRASNYLHIEVPGARAPRNTWCTVEIDGMHSANGLCQSTLIEQENS
jgi:threonylcarbamoyladenosine tRNA methylthiotransferase MtaB